jgi:hypothetical protein
MALNSSGPISLGGATAGQSIALELGLSPTAPISLNQTNVRTLAGVPSGAIIMPTNFYGKSAGPTIGLFYGGFQACVGISNTATRINACGALIGSQTTVGTARGLLAGAKVGNNGLFYSGYNSCYVASNTVTRINACGALAGFETTVGVIRRNNLAGATVGSNGLFYAGYYSSCCGGGPNNFVTRINACGALVGSQTSAGSVKACLAGATVGSNGLFYGGYSFVCFCATNIVTRINACGALVGSETTAGTTKCALAGATVGSNGLFYGGQFCYYPINTVARINACGALVGSQTSVGTGRNNLAGATVGSNGVFYGGRDICFNYLNTVTRINACGALVGSQTSVGSAVGCGPAGAGL